MILLTTRKLTFAMSSEARALAAFRVLRKAGVNASLGRTSGGTTWHRLTVTVTDDDEDSIVSTVRAEDRDARQQSR